MNFRCPMLYQRVPLPRVPQWAIQSHLNSPANLHKPGQPPVHGITHQVLLLQLHLVCLLAHQLPTCLLVPHQQECILPSPPGHQFLFLLLVLLVLQVLHIHLLVLPHQGNIRHQACPSPRFQGHMGVPLNQVHPLLLLEHGDPCPLEGGEPQLGDSILHLVCHIHLQGHIPLPLRLQGLLLQCRGVLSPQDHGDLRLLPHFLHQQDPTQLQGCTRHHLILTKCHLRLLEHHPYLVALIPTVELVAGCLPTYGIYKEKFLVIFWSLEEPTCVLPAHLWCEGALLQRLFCVRWIRINTLTAPAL